MLKIISAIVLIGVVFLLVRYATNTKQIASESAAKGAAFLAENAKAEGVKTTASGLQYKVLTTGTGTVHPTATDRVRSGALSWHINQRYCF